MRLLIYLLALISGFSAAEAARAEVSPASAVAHSAVAAAEALASQEQQASARPADHRPGNILVFVAHEMPLALIAPTPVTRRDVSRQ
jgi:hypothetical protein